MAGQLVTALEIERYDGTFEALLTPGVRRVSGAAGLAGIGVRSVVTPRAGRHGSVNRTRHRSDQLVTIDGILLGPDADTAWWEYTEVARALADSVDEPRLLRYTLGTGLALEMAVQLESLAPTIEVGPDMVRYQATFRAADPVGYGQVEKSVSTGALMGALNVPPPQLLATNLVPNPNPLPGGSTAPWVTADGGNYLNPGASLGINPAGGPVINGTSYPAYFVVTTPGTAFAEGIRVPLAAPPEGWVAGAVYKARLMVHPLNGTGGLQVFLGHTSIANGFAQVSVTPSGWIGVNATFTAPNNTATAAAVRTASAQARTFAVAVVQVEKVANTGVALAAYFDGDSPLAKWTGTPHNSTSELYDREIGGKFAFPLTLPFAFDPAPEHSVLVYNAGTVDSDPVIDLYGYLKDPVIQLEDHQFVIVGEIADGDVLTINTATREITLNGSANRLNMRNTVLSRWLELPARPTVIQLLPASFSGRAEMAVRYRDAHQ